VAGWKPTPSRRLEAYPTYRKAYGLDLDGQVESVSPQSLESSAF
jgi:hypothetical protein